VIGLSLPRDNRSFSRLALDDQLSRRGAMPRCGLLVVDLQNGDAVHSVRLEGAIHELYDVAALPGSLLPLLAVRLHIDPTVVSGPVMSTLVDATGLLIYFNIARFMLRG
jgi:Mg/Co/Ni transporter MgtE